MQYLTIIFIICGILFSGKTSAQSVPEMRQIKTTALQVYEHYKVVTSGLYSKNAYTEDNFMALFETTALIYNDILPDNNPRQLSPSLYYKKFKASVKRIYPAFSDFKMGEPVSVGDKWQIKCNFTREARFLTQHDMKYPQWSFNYIMTIEMDKSYNTNSKVYENARIASVDVSNPLKGFFIIENKENIPLLKKSGETVKDWDKEYQSRIFPEDKWKISDISVSDSISKGNFFGYSKSKFTKNQTDANFYKLEVLRLKKNIVGAGIYFSPVPVALGYKKITDPVTHSNRTIKSVFALSMSAFYGKQIYHKEKATVFAKAGLDFNYIYCKYDKELSKRENFDDKINIISGSIPLSVEYLRQLTAPTKKPIFLSFELGVFPELKTNTQKTVLCFSGGFLGSVGLWYALNKNSLLKFNISYKYNFNLSDLKNPNRSGFDEATRRGLQNIGIGISWVKTIGGK